MNHQILLLYNTILYIREFEKNLIREKKTTSVFRLILFTQLKLLQVEIIFSEQTIGTN